MQERFGIEALAQSDAGHDHDVPLEPLGAVHGEDFDCALSGCRRGVQRGGKFIEGITRQFLGAWLGGQRTEEFPSIEQFAFFRASGRAAQAQPGPIDALPQRQGALRPRQRRCKGQAQALHPALRIHREQCHPRRIVGKLPQCRALVFTQRLQFRQRQAAIRGVQHRQPGAAIAGVLQRARQRTQVTHHRAFTQRLELQAADGNSGRQERGGDRCRLLARIHQYRQPEPRLPRPARAHQLDNSRRLRFRGGRTQRMHAHRPFQVRACCDGRQVADRRQACVITLRKQRTAVGVDPVDELRRGAKILPQLE